MRRLLLFPIVLLLIPGRVGAQPDDLSRQFKDAIAAYEEGRYRQAADTYTSILEAGRASTALYYNLGNAYVRLDRLGQAIRYYEKARALQPRNARVLHNLEQARRRAGVYPGTLPPRGLPGLVRGWSPLAIVLAGILLLASGLVVAVAWSSPASRGVWRRPLVWAPLVGGLFVVALGLGTSAVQAQEARAVVVVDRATLHRTPKATARTDTSVSEGTLVEVRTDSTRWRRVRLASGATGWVPARALGDV